MSILLQKIETMEQLEEMARLEAEIWGTSPIPTHQTVTAAKNGGIIIGAFVGGKMVGFVYSFPGYENGEVYLCSHMMGIAKPFRDRGIGYMLKMKQAQEAIQRGYRKIRWTYDPLESRNGYVNIAKLGAICSQYIENCYGEMDDAFNKHLPSDRFVVEWLLESRYLQERGRVFSELRWTPESVVLGWRQHHNDDLEPVWQKQDADHASFLFVAIPLQFQALKERNPSLALDWRYKTRAVFTRLFRDGWAVAHVIRREHEPVLYYVCVRRDQLPL
ncbi:GNAT family N-acetyltransferase [Saccharococcus caldoxylosilyticus]|uniref:N-acetyltransferase domain-containing protein n=1 Tax=Parageobacillus caldoxylosilyticus NBRC 107762 TaxID=1220594 RepID=A0A023DCA5_9BACL|nr:GNAT family N-acetyltransferase [Parageobacillus caldoxylosilyticus]MBB3851844.1 putative GNAT superfamily acetyltransferase [Parageobacillus caldoxylosilyticus]QXJ37670.1 hypothetical protein BV455_00932 [Parageobacillus caldoxylosilyticus]GAJ38924.1 hypothetical protein GCA01S_010_00510 [Parageobacillus caldoxylosilyticus NBRC 107762]